jgi:hypothetical protein
MISILALVLLVSGCSSLSKEDCLDKNWFQLGQEDAMSGVSEPKTADYRRDCSQHGIQIKSMDYLKGFESGLKKFCTYSNGLYRGEAGEDNHSLCEEANPEYKRGYVVGFRKMS